MPELPTDTAIHAPVQGTALVADLRNFTPNLAADEERFCKLLARVDQLWVEACMLAVPSAKRAAPPMVMGSTGDGIIAAFFDPEWHFGHAYLAGLMLQRAVHRETASYRTPARSNRVGYGIGIESGRVRRVGASWRGGPKLDTVIGSCINVAARAEAVSKNLHKANTILGVRVTALLIEALFQEDYRALMEQRHARDDDDYVGRQRRMETLNQKLCLAYIQKHKLRGVHRPTALFKVSLSAARPGVPRFDRLLDGLVRGDHQHRAEVMSLLR